MNVNNFNRFKISRLTIVLGILMAGAIVASAVVTALVLRNHEIELWRKQLSNHTLTLAEHTHQTMASGYAALDGIAERVQAEAADSPAAFRDKLGTPAIYRMLKGKIELLPQVDVATIVASNGDVINFTRSHPAPTINLADRDYFKTQASQVGADRFVSSSVQNKVTGKWLFFLSRRINDSRGGMLGLVLVGISVESFSHFYEQLGVNLGQGASVTLYRRDFEMLTRWPFKPELIGRFDTTGPSHNIIENQKSDNDVIYTDAPRFSDDNRRIARLGAVRLVKNYPLIVSISVTEEFFLDSWHRYVKWIMAISLGSIAALLASIAVITTMMRLRENDMRELVELRNRAEIQCVDLIAARKQLDDEQIKFHAVVESLGDGISIKDLDYLVTYQNRAMIEMLGDQTGLSCYEIFGLSKPCQDCPTIKTIIDGQTHSATRIFQKNDKTVHIESTASLMRDSLGTVTGTVEIIRDISERFKNEQTIRDMAFHDLLTGLPNRRLFEDRLEQTLATSRRNNTGFGLLFLDLDHFKEINDTFGHEAGDLVLINAGERIRSCCKRDLDTISRQGGDEFCVIITDCSEREQLDEIAKNLLRAFSAPFKVGTSEIMVTTSIGISIFPADGIDARIIEAAADKAMYEAKRSGRNSHIFYDTLTV